MYPVLHFKNFSYFNGHTPTIAGDHFHTLIDLCFSAADTFSLHRCGWPKAHDGALEQALRPYLCGEYRSYCRLEAHGQALWEKCYLYHAADQAKQILLKHIHHLFDQEESTTPAGHAEYLHQKYAPYWQVQEQACDRWIDYLSSGGDEQPEEQQAAAERAIFQEANAIWQDIFSEDDHYSTMEDLCFFQGADMFFETITHEEICRALVVSPSFQAALCQLGDWEGPAVQTTPLFSLHTAEDWLPYPGFVLR